MNRQLSQAVVGDVFSFDANLRTTSGVLSTGYISVDYVFGATNKLICSYNINDGVRCINTSPTNMTPLTDQNTTFVEHVERGLI